MDTQLSFSESHRLRVMIADDVQETRRSVRLMLSTIAGMEVVAIAQNGQQAVEMNERYRPDIALMDVNMPEMDGITAIRQMVAANPSLICIVISAERDNLTLRQAMAAGARGYLLKPFMAEELEEIVGHAMSLAEKNRLLIETSGEVIHQRDAYLKQLAQEYANARRTDDAAVAIFEQLAASPVCEMRWLMHLAMMYVLRRDWGRLKSLAERLERQSAKVPV
jgi:YesN/AraC family two-component response regulator